MGQVYAVESIVTSIIMWTALILYNPVLALLSAVGAGLGTLLPLNFLGIVNPQLNIIGVFFVFRCFRLWFSVLWVVGLQLHLIHSSSVLGISPCFLVSAETNSSVFIWKIFRKSFMTGIINVFFTVFAQKSLIQTMSKVCCQKY